MEDTLKYIDIKVHPVDNGWVVTSDIIYKDILIKDGFYSNGANIPRLLWSLLPPNDPATFPAVFVHDYLCDLGHYIKADNYLEQILIDSKVSMWKRKAIVVGVRFYTKWLRR